MLCMVTVCSGNICRSPMAEAILIDLSAERGIPANVSSCGTAELVGEKMTNHSRRVLKKLGVPAIDHRSRGLSGAREDLEEADRILVMENRHAEILERDFRIDGGKIALLGTFDPEGGDPDIFDPYGCDFKVYLFAGERIRRSCKCFLDNFKGGLS